MTLSPPFSPVRPSRIRGIMRRMFSWQMILGMVLSIGISSLFPYLFYLATGFKLDATVASVCIFILSLLITSVASFANSTLKARRTRSSLRAHVIPLPGTRICERCGAVVKSRKRFCTSCGTAMPVAAPEETVQTVGHQVTASTPDTSSDLRFCANCGTRIMPDNSFCENCGTRKQ